MDGPSLFIYNWLIGWAAAALASTIAMPFDTVKRVLMTDTYESTKRYRSMIHCWASLIQEDGFERLWRGIYKLNRACPRWNFDHGISIITFQAPFRISSEVGLLV